MVKLVRSFFGNRIWCKRISCRKSKLKNLRKCLEMTALSTMFPDVGSLTGSYISVPMIGSRNSSGASATSSSSSCWALPMACNTHFCFINNSQTFDLKRYTNLKSLNNSATQFCSYTLHECVDENVHIIANMCPWFHCNLFTFVHTTINEVYI